MTKSTRIMKENYSAHQRMNMVIADLERALELVQNAAEQAKTNKQRDLLCMAEANIRYPLNILSEEQKIVGQMIQDALTK